jgi:hypothetical protein
MPILVRKEKSVLFVHIPKCGGSSFLKEMNQRGWLELLSIRGLHAHQLKFMRCSPQHLHADLLYQLINPEAFDHIITLVREPLARFMSEYCWQKIQGMTNLQPKQWIEHTIAAFKKNPFVDDNHIRPQSEFILSDAQIYKLEEDGVDKALEAVSPVAEGLYPDVEKLKSTTKSPTVLEAFEEAKNRICEFYAKDYELLGYAFPAPFVTSAQTTTPGKKT